MTTPTPSPKESSPDAPPSNRITQLLLDPRGLQLLMTAGGGLLALGLVLWLVVIGVFDQPLHAAMGLGFANLALLGTGVAVALKTRYRSAGRAVAMLACLLLPLNLWFYDAQGLVTLANGGNLWLPALVGCVLYAAVARLLKDSLFVYACVSGIAMTGLLFLADADVARFGEILAPSALLAVLGVVCVHAERLFPVTAIKEEFAAFTRNDFGLAFFRSGHVLLGSGLAVLFVGRLGRFYSLLFADWGWFTEPDVVTLPSVQLAALGIALLGAYTYAYSWIVAGNRRFIVSSLLMLVWSVVMGFDLLQIPFTEELFVGTLAFASLACCLTGRLLLPEKEEKGADVSTSLSTTAMITAGTASVLTLLQLLRSFVFDGGGWIDFDFGWSFVGSSALVLIAQGSLLKSLVSKDSQVVSLTGFALSLLAFLGGLLGISPMAAELSGSALLLLFSLIPLGSIIAAYITKNTPWRQGMIRAAEGTAALLAVFTLPTILVESSVSTIAMFASFATIYGLTAAITSRRIPAVLATIMTIAAAWQAVVVFGLGVHGPLLAMSLLGLVLIVVDRLRPVVNLALVGRIGILLSGVAGGLLAATRLASLEVSLPLLGLLVAQTVIAALAAWLTPTEKGRHGLMLVAALGFLTAGATLNSLSLLSTLQRVELLTTVVGMVALTAGHIGWRREIAKEGESSLQDDLVDINLWAGSLLTAVPLVLGLIDIRFGGGNAGWIALHEIGVLGGGLLLLGSGVLCRLRATTLTGATTLLVYLLSLVALINVPDQLQSVAVYLMLGGGALFGGAVLLSVYRDRLLALPDRIREGEGVFAVLKWR